MTKRILITRHRRHIGSWMTPFLIDSGYDEADLDKDYSRDCTLIPDRRTSSAITKDIRDLASSDLQDIDVVIHLAALSNDPIGNLNRGWTEEINHRASVRLAELAKQAGVRRFLFSSSCIM